MQSIHSHVTMVVGTKEALCGDLAFTCTQCHTLGRLTFGEDTLSFSPECFPFDIILLCAWFSFDLSNRGTPCFKNYTPPDKPLLSILSSDNLLTYYSFVSGTTPLMSYRQVSIVRMGYCKAL
ncbi:unnamed protein product [Choristocarpus tenellus]